MSKQIFVYEEDPMLAQLIERYLSEMNTPMNVVVNKSQQDLFQALKDGVEPDLLLIDADGFEDVPWELVNSLRDRGYEGEVSLISSVKEKDFVRKSIQSGVLDYVIKPFNKLRLQQTIHKLQVKQQLFNQGTGKLSQNTVDQWLSNQVTKPNVRNIEVLAAHEQGLSAKTLRFILDIFKRREDWFSVKELAHESNLSHVTIGKYLAFLKKYNLLDTRIQYPDLGRPFTQYRLIEDQ